MVDLCDAALALAGAGDPFAGRHLIDACSAARDLLLTQVDATVAVPGKKRGAA